MIHRSINREVNYYRTKGFSDEWIKARLSGIVDRFKLTDIWKDGGINKLVEFALLTNEIYKVWSGMKVAKRGESVAKGARDLYGKETGKTAISSDNALNYKYVEKNLIESK